MKQYSILIAIYIQNIGEKRLIMSWHALSPNLILRRLRLKSTKILYGKSVGCNNSVHMTL